MLAVAERIPTASAPFTSVEAALRWAFGIPSSSRRIEQHAVVQEAERGLDPRVIEYIHARFGGSSERLPNLRMWVIAGLPSGIHKGRGVEKLILNALGHEIGLKSLQRDLRCTTSGPLSVDQVKAYRRITRERVNAIRDLAMDALEKRFREKGWIAS